MWSQVKHTKLAREHEASVRLERALQSQVEELQEEVRDVSATCRSRMRWLEAAAEQVGAWGWEGGGEGATGGRIRAVGR